MGTEPMSEPCFSLEKKYLLIMCSKISITLPSPQAKHICPSWNELLDIIRFKYLFFLRPQGKITSTEELSCMCIHLSPAIQKKRTFYKY